MDPKKTVSRKMVNVSLSSLSLLLRNLKRIIVTIMPVKYNIKTG
jgi:hypothetical protein